MKLPAEVEAIIERLVRECGFTDPRTAGTPTVELVWRSLKLQRDLYERTAAREHALMGAKAAAAKLPELERKAVDAEDVLAIEVVKLELRTAIDGEFEQIALDPRSGRHGGKSVAGLSREKRRALRRLIEDIGGEAGDGGYAADLLDFDPHHFERAMLLVRSEVEPENDAERAALARYREKVQHG